VKHTLEGHIRFLGDGLETDNILQRKENEGVDMKKILAFSVLLVLMIVLGAYAQFGGKTQQGPGLYGEFKPVVGAWAEYQIKAQKEAPTKMKIAIVGKEGQSYWYETVTEGKERIVSKMLISGDPKDQKSVKRMIVKTGNNQAMEMPVMGMGKQAAKPQDQPKGKIIDKGTENITVPAGTFMTRHFQYQDGKEVVDSWSSEKVPPYGMVKSGAKDFEMVLMGYGTGAKSLITETPKKFQMPKMPQGFPQGMPPGMGNQ
jgi:(2Fe-2S) ferredoxin